MTTEIRTQGHCDEGLEEEHGVDTVDLVRIACVAISVLVVWVVTHKTEIPDGVVIAGGAVVIATGGWPILGEAKENLLQRRMTMELSIAIALFAALAINQVFVALLITTFVLEAEVLDGLTVARGRHAIEDLLRYLPRTALEQPCALRPKRSA